jgi:hypothetical protein
MMAVQLTSQSRPAIMKTPEQLIALHRTQADRSLTNLQNQAIRDNPFLLALNHRIAHQNSFAVALIDWRHSLADPRPDLRTAYEVCRGASQAIPGITYPEPLFSRFRFYDRVFLAVLLGEEVSADVRDLLEQCLLLADIHNALDYALALALATNEPRRLGAVISQQDFPKRLKLYQQTYEDYERLMNGDAAALASAESNYSDRARDKYYSEGFLIDGGGPHNPSAVDYRLAAILKACGVRTESPHRLP